MKTDATGWSPLRSFADQLLVALANPTQESLRGIYVRAVFEVPRFRHLTPLFTDGWRVDGFVGESPVLTKSGRTLVLDRSHARALVEEGPQWRRTYLPEFSLKGKTVLDVGAGAGETADLFFEAGAKKVIAVESDEKLGRYLSANAKTNDWDLEIHLEPFKVEHLGIAHDFAKIDCEGGERVLLDERAASLKPCRIELHPWILGRDVSKELVDKFGLKLVGPSGGNRIHRELCYKSS